MKFSTSILLASALLVPLYGAAQAPSLLPNSKTELSAAPAPVTAPLCIGTAFNASLLDTLDTRRAKAGDPVTAEITEDVTYQRSVIFPKGTKVTGHIVRANSAGHGRRGSALFIQFDKAVLEGGQEVILNAGIQAFAVDSSAPADAPKEGAAPASPETLRPIDQEKSSETEGESGSLVVSTIYDASPRGLRPPLFAETTAQGEINGDGLFTPESRGAFGRPDVKIYTPTSEGSHGTVLLSAKKSIHLESGTHLLLVVQPPPTGANTPEARDAIDETPNP